MEKLWTTLWGSEEHCVKWIFLCKKGLQWTRRTESWPIRVDKILIQIQNFREVTDSPIRVENLLIQIQDFGEVTDSPIWVENLLIQIQDFRKITDWPIRVGEIANFRSRLQESHGSAKQSWEATNSNSRLPIWVWENKRLKVEDSRKTIYHFRGTYGIYMFIFICFFSKADTY